MAGGPKVRGPRQAAVALLVAGALTACTPPATSGSAGSITVFAAASLTDVFGRIGRLVESAHPGAHVRFSFAASSTLAAQIAAGAPADVFAAAGPSPAARLAMTGVITAPVVFARNSAAIAVAPAAARRVRALADLASPHVAVVLCQAEVPCGMLAARVLERTRLRVSPVSRSLDVRSVLAAVAGGEADAGIVYVTDVRAAGRSVVGVSIPDAQNASTSYPIATVRGSHNPQLAEVFRAAVLSDQGRRVLADAGFALP